MRQAQALIGAEAVAARADEGGNRFGATARAGLTGTGVLVGRIRKGILRHYMKLAGGPDFHQWDESEQQDTCTEDREYRVFHGSSSWLELGSSKKTSTDPPAWGKAWCLLDTTFSGETHTI